MDIVSGQSIFMLGAAIALLAALFQRLDLSGKKLESQRRDIEIHIKSIEQITHQLEALKVSAGDFKIQGVSFNEAVQTASAGAIEANIKNNELILQTLQEIQQAERKNQRARNWIELLVLAGAALGLAGYFL